MDVSNLYGMLTLLATCLLLPVALFLEGSTMLASFQALWAAGMPKYA